MIKKILKIWGAVCLVAVCGIMVQSCCRPDDVKICGVALELSITADNRVYNENQQDGIDTSYNHFAFQLIGSNKKINDVCLMPRPFIQSAYAFQPCLDNIRDSIPRVNVKLSLNRDVIFNGTTIPAGTNLIADPNIANAIDYTYELYGNYYGQISMDSTNYQLLQLDTGIYKVSVQTITAQGNTDIQLLDVVLKQ